MLCSTSFVAYPTIEQRNGEQWRRQEMSAKSERRRWNKKNTFWTRPSRNPMTYANIHSNRRTTNNNSVYIVSSVQIQPNRGCSTENIIYMRLFALLFFRLVKMHGLNLICWMEIRRWYNNNNVCTGEKQEEKKHKTTITTQHNNKKISSIIPSGWIVITFSMTGNRSLFYY